MVEKQANVAGGPHMGIKLVASNVHVGGLLVQAHGPWDLNQWKHDILSTELLGSQEASLDRELCMLPMFAPVHLGPQLE